MFLLQEEGIKTNLSIYILMVYILDVITTYENCLMRLPVVFCAQHELNYNLKTVILAIVI